MRGYEEVLNVFAENVKFCLVCFSVEEIKNTVSLIIEKIKTRQVYELRFISTIIL